MTDLLIAATTAVIADKGRTYRIRKGETVVRADDPIVQGRERLFKPLVVSRLGGRGRESSPLGVATVGASETATAAPGELRQLQMPKVDTKAVREWAAENGYDVSARGKLPAEVVDAYLEAHEPVK